LLVLAAVGCGGGGSTTTTTVPIRTATPAAAAECLNSVAFLVEPARKRVRGSSPGGVNFTVNFYESPAAAAAALAPRDPEYSAAIASTVVDWSGNPPLHPGGLPMTLVNNDLASLRNCIEVRPPA
jgi:hypothetical protein